MTTPPPPLRGIRVLDLCRLLPGPYATWLLGSMGAEVLKVEDTGVGDYARNMPPMIDDVSAMFHVLNRGKRSLSLDLKCEEGRALLLRMVQGFDVVIEQFRPGVMERLGIGYETLREANKDIILCSITGYGQDGPFASQAGHDLNYQALAGTLWMEGAADGPPSVPGMPTGDLYGAMAAVSSVVAALLRRERSGGGEWIDISISDIVASVGAPLLAAATQQAEPMPGRGEGILNGGLAQYSTYRTLDDRYLAVAALEPKFMMRFAELVGHPEWLQVIPLPGAHQEPLREEIAEVIAGRTRDEWVELLKDVDCCVTPVLDPREAATHPHFTFRGLAASAPKGQGSACWVDTPLGQGNGTKAPMQGEHSDEILSELGIDGADIAALRQRQVIR